MNDLFKVGSPHDLLEIRDGQLLPFKIRDYNEAESSFCNNYYELISSNFVIRVGIIFGYGLSVGLVQNTLTKLCELEEKGDKERTFYFLLHDFSSLISESLATNNIIEIQAEMDEALIKVKNHLRNYQGFLFLFGIFGKEDSTSYLLSIFPKIFHDLGEIVINKPQLVRISVDIKDQIEKGGVNEKERN